ncbi:DmpA family aminopeptidase [Lignipirellula cremea]|uniref:Peptidase family S58 n=1 Tax=Lignipirellula cremea TaxID=2528010 RepID=A0A518DV43_9BACT|nr:P1 family peptidase [Lignipirellula cremea]QDU95711.1 Peptidase family S58 [Lignipirellula cremea]
MPVAPASSAEPKPRARDLGVPFDGVPGPLNAITDVPGVEVGHVTLIQGDGPLVVGQGPVRTGVTAILPRGKNSRAGCFAGGFSLNGNGEMTGVAWIDEAGALDGPVMITNTHSVGVVRDAVIEWLVKRDPKIEWALPVVAETYDGFLNDINGFHVTKEHAFQALDNAKSGPVAEGNVGGGTGMRVHRFKGGIGTSSRRLTKEDGGYMVGVLVQANYGQRDQLRIAGVPVGREIPDLMPELGDVQTKPPGDGNSIIIIVATDAPLLPHQLRRVVKRAALGLARNGGVAEHTSGDLFLAFSTANPGVVESDGEVELTMLPNARMSPLFTATVEAVEEAIVNSLIAAETMAGVNGNKTYALPHDRLQAILRKYNRLRPTD